MDKLRPTTTGENVTVVAAIVLLVAAFKPWLRIEVVGVDGRLFSEYTRNGLQDPSGSLSLLAVLIGLAMAALIVARAVGAIEVPAGLRGVGWGVAHLLGGVLALGLVVARWLGNTEHGARSGLYLGLLGAAGLAAGGLLIALEKSGLSARSTARRSARRTARRSARPSSGPSGEPAVLPRSTRRSARRTRRHTERVRRGTTTPIPAGPGSGLGPGLGLGSGAPPRGGPAGWTADAAAPGPVDAAEDPQRGRETTNGTAPDSDDTSGDPAGSVPDARGPRWV